MADVADATTVRDYLDGGPEDTTVGGIAAGTGLDSGTVTVVLDEWIPNPEADPVWIGPGRGGPWVVVEVPPSNPPGGPGEPEPPHPITQMVGNGSDTNFSVRHDFASRTPNVFVRENTAPYEQVQATIRYTTLDTIDVSFATPPTTDQYAVTVRP